MLLLFAENIWLSDIAEHETDPFSNNPRSYFKVNILLTYRTAQLPSKPKQPVYKWEEKSNKPTPGWARKGQTPDQWADLFSLDNRAIPNNWKYRKNTCDQMSRMVFDGDQPTAEPSRGYRYVQFRLSVVNPPECKCPTPVVQVTAKQVYDPTKSPPMALKTPDPDS